MTRPPAICGLCGHPQSLECGYSSVTHNGRVVYLCHADDHSCYRRVSVYHEELDPEYLR